MTLEEQNAALRALVEEQRRMLERHEFCGESEFGEGYGPCMHCHSSGPGHDIRCPLRVLITKEVP